MALLNYDPDNTLAGGLYSMTPREAIRLGVALCRAVEYAVGADGVHGGVWPGNITCADGQVALGPASRAAIAEMQPDMLEYVAPEQFWVGSSTPASDVYSIGLVLYTALNRGVKPFFASAGEDSPEARADAMQNRMKGTPLPYPATAGRALGDVVLRAVAFQAGDRYETPGRLRAALEALPEGSEVPAVVPVVPLTEEERQNMPNYRVDKDFEEPELPRRSKRDRRSKGKARLAALALDQSGQEKTEEVMRRLVGGSSAPDAPAEELSPATPHAPVPQPAPTPAKTPPPVPPSPPEPPIRDKGSVDEDMDPEVFRSGGGGGAKRFILPLLLVAVIAMALILLARGCRNGEEAPVESSLPSSESAAPETDGLIHPPVEITPMPGFETPEPSPELTEAPAPEETPEPEPEPVYELILADVSWTQARDLCEQRGGHLATVHDQAQLDKIIELARAQNARFVWLGAFRGDSSTWYYVTGERMDFAVWDVGEPSAVDASDGTREDYLLLWDRTDNGNWCYNDQRNDPVTPYWFIYGGRTAYVCEYNG